jgi:hypothetical protein
LIAKRQEELTKALLSYKPQVVSDPSFEYLILSQMVRLINENIRLHSNYFCCC